MKSYKEYIRERKDVLHDKEEKIGYIRSKLGLNHDDGMSEPEDDTEFTYTNDREKNEPNDTLMAKLHGAEYRGMEADYAAKKMAVKASEAEYEKDELEKQINKLDKSDKKLEKMIKKIRKAISGKDEEEEAEETEEQPEQSDEQQTETSPEESAPEEGAEETAEETTDTEEGEEGEEGGEEESEEDEGSKNILSKKLDLSWRQRKGQLIKEDNNTDKKYEFTDETEVVDGHTLHRIVALKDFGDVEAGDLGGCIESEENLSQEGLCWVERYAKVYGRASVFENAIVRSNARIIENAMVYGDAVVTGGSLVGEHARVYGDSEITWESIVKGYSTVVDSLVREGSVIDGKSIISSSELIDSDVMDATIVNKTIEEQTINGKESSLKYEHVEETNLHKKLRLIRECRHQQKMHHLFERLHKERVIRDGKTKIKYKTDRADDGFKVSVDNEGHAREEKMTTQEILDRKKQQKRAQRKRDPKLKQMTRNRLRSARIRKMKGFDN